MQWHFIYTSTSIKVIRIKIKIQKFLHQWTVFVSLATQCWGQLQGVRFHNFVLARIVASTVAFSLWHMLALFRGLWWANGKKGKHLCLSKTSWITFSIFPKLESFLPSSLFLIFRLLYQEPWSTRCIFIFIFYFLTAYSQISTPDTQRWSHEWCTA